MLRGKSWARAHGAETRLTSWVRTAQEDRSATNISVFVVKVQPDRNRRGDSQPRHVGGLISGMSFGETNGACTWIPKISSGKLPHVLTAASRMTIASTTEEPSTKHNEGCIQSIHSRLRAAAEDTDEWTTEGETRPASSQKLHVSETWSGGADPP